MNSPFADRLLVGLFCAALALPTSLRLAGWGAPFSAEVEKRPPAAWPELEYRRRGPLRLPRTASLEAFPQRFEAWLNDRLGLRRELLQLYAWARLQGVVPAAAAAIGDGGAARCPVLIGLDGWLFYTGEGSLEGFRRTRPFNTAQLEAWRRILRERRDWLARRGIAYLVVVAPDKQTIYPEQMPASQTRIGPRSRLDQLLGAVDARRDAELLDLRPALEAAKRERPVYYRTDSHWNAYGAHVGERAIVERLQRHLPTLRPTTPADYEVTDGPTPGGGDLAVMLDAPTPPVDRRIELRPRTPRRAVVEPTPIALDDGSYVRGLAATCAGATSGTAVVLHDSFFEEPRAAFNEHWRRVVYAQTYEFPAALIERERPQAVVQEIVERALMNLVPRNPPLPESAVDWAERTTAERR